ncbi:unnamed protein product [Dibothriocephalus latus]|uniref:Uncharacterized protein n=1 Tax=Dibothriocephalus latus TaxID=60516 RepID=A0A3P7MAD1_DIBLA|nr:unnamed protein product [Dibothriocephalus latus]
MNLTEILVKGQKATLEGGAVGFTPGLNVARKLCGRGSEESVVTSGYEHYEINNSLKAQTQRGMMISAAKSSVTVFTLDPKKLNRRPANIVNGACLPKLLGVRSDPLFTVADHAREVVGKVSPCTKVLKALAGKSWG